LKPLRATCRVCAGGQAAPFQSVEGRNYWRCGACAATFLDASQLPDRETERARYLLHENDPDDEDYRRFLGKLAAPLLARLKPAQEGLDYGCGPGPALARMLVEAGHSVRLYDPFFCAERSALARAYDFITCTEAAEHFHHPAAEFARMDRLLRPGGWLAVMTSFQQDDDVFAAWHYRRDPTHVAFYKEETLRYVAAQFGWTCETPAKDVALMRKPERLDPAESGEAPNLGPLAVGKDYP
jgi:2-polyprenyl-3-methyl-5-hydroxy-6-metoxy-1,4-benzoquinol methylase